MRAHRGNLQAASPRQFRESAAQFDHVGTSIDNRLANFSAELNDRLVHLRLDLLFEGNFPALEDFLDVRPKFACLRIDNGEFLFDTEGEHVVFGTHAGDATLLQKQLSVIPSRADDEGPHKEWLRFSSTPRDQRCSCEVLRFAQDDRAEIVDLTPLRLTNS